MISGIKTSRPVILAAFVLGLIGGWTANGWRGEARLQALETAHEQALNAAQKAAVAALEKVRQTEQQGETLAQRQISLEAQNQKLGKERDHALRQLTKGRACLGPAALRLLNDRSAGAGHGLSAPAALAPGPLAAVAAGSGIRGAGIKDQGSGIKPDVPATDTDLALWVSNAIDQYDLCRGRIDTLRQFFENTTH